MHVSFIPNLNSRLYSQQSYCALSNSVVGSVAFACGADGGAHVTKYCCGLQLWQLLFSSYLLFTHSELFLGEPSVIVEGRLSSISQIRDVTSFRFLLHPFPGGSPLSSSHTFPTMLFPLVWLPSSFLFTSNDPHFSSFFCLTTPLFGRSSTVGLQ